MNDNENEKDVLPSDDGNDRNDGSDEKNAELNEILYGSEYSEYLDALGSEDENDDGALPEMSTFSLPSDDENDKNGEKKKKPATVLKKQTKLIIVFSVIFVVLLALTLVLGPTGYDVFGLKTEEETPSIPFVDGEVSLSASGKRLLFEHIERENLQSVEVHNSHGTYTAYYNNINGDFCFLGAEDALYDETLFSSLVVSSGYVVMQDRLGHEERNPDYSEYGLAETDERAYYIITTRDGRSYKLYIGKSTLDGSGYYAMVDGRDEIYVIGSSIESTLLADVKTLLTPIITFPIEGNDYLTEIKKFYISRNSEAYIGISYVGETDDKESAGITIPFTIFYPKYFTASTTQVQTLFSSAVNLTGDEILEVGIYEEDGVDENGDKKYKLRDGLAEKYFLDEPAYDMLYYYTDNNYISFVTFSPKQRDEDGNEFYYATSQIYDTIVKISADKVKFLEWELVDYLERSIFNYHIDYVKSIEITGKDKNFLFTLTGTGEALEVTEKHSGKILRSYPKGENLDAGDNVYNFRQFYKTSLSVYTEDSVDESTIGEKALLLTVTVTLRNGKSSEYKFYSYSDLRCYYTINGEGEFFVKRSAVTKMVRDAQKVVDGIAVDSEAEV